MGTEAPTSVRRCAVDDWQQVRDVRLAALHDAPQAFTSTFERESHFGEATWQDRLVTSAWFLAESDAAPVGVACGWQEPDAPADERHLVSFWVDPEHRGRGVADALLAAAIDWAVGESARELTLWVIVDNVAAQRVYERHGFTPTGEVQAVPGRPDSDEEKWRLPLPG